MLGQNAISATPEVEVERQMPALEQVSRDSPSPAGIQAAGTSFVAGLAGGCGAVAVMVFVVLACAGFSA